MKQVLDFLIENHKKVLKPTEWQELLDIRIMDPDGWKNREDWETPVGLIEFIKKLIPSTMEFSLK